MPQNFVADFFTLNLGSAFAIMLFKMPHSLLISSVNIIEWMDHLLKSLIFGYMDCCLII